MKYFVGNQNTIKYLEKSITTNNLSHAYLFCGPLGVGKTTAGKHFARLLLCTGEKPLDCSDCPSCKLFEHGNHPDFFHLSGKSLMIDEVRELINSLDLKTYYGKGKIVLISHAENLTPQAQNALLKTLEEPSEKTTIILTTENSKNLLQTITSRVRMVNFGLVREKEIYELLNGELGVVKDVAKMICTISSGRPGIAVLLSNNQENVFDTISLTNDFVRIYKSTDIYEKISFADKLSKDKDHLLTSLDNLAIVVRSSILNEKFTGSNKKKVSELVYMIDDIEKSRMRLISNANTKLVLESLLLGGVR